MPEYKDVVELGTALRRHRKALRKSQKDVAAMIGVEQPTVARWEKGRRPEPEYFEVLAGFLGVERDLVVQLAHQPAIDDGLGDVIVSAYGRPWYLMPLERRVRWAAQIEGLLDADDER